MIKCPVCGFIFPKEGFELVDSVGSHIKENHPGIYEDFAAILMKETLKAADKIAEEDIKGSGEKPVGFLNWKKE